MTEYKCIGKNKNEIFFKNFKNLHFYSNHNVLKNSRYHGGLSEWGRSNRPRIRPGTVKSLNAPRGLSQLALRQDYAKKIDPCRMLVWLGRRTVQNMVKNRAAIESGQYTVLSGRPVQTGQVLFELKFTTGIECSYRYKNFQIITKPGTNNSY